VTTSVARAIRASTRKAAGTSSGQRVNARR
jgi:hypothetical protein